MVRGGVHMARQSPALADGEGSQIIDTMNLIGMVVRV
jgi:hypothetical protein